MFIVNFKFVKYILAFVLLFSFACSTFSSQQPAPTEVKVIPTEVVSTEEKGLITAENADQIGILSQWYDGEINGSVDNWFFNADGTLVGINTPYGIYLIDLASDATVHWMPDQPYEHTLKAISPDGKYLVTEDNESARMRDQGKFQQKLYLWDVEQQTIIIPLDVGVSYDQSPYPYLSVIAMAFSPDGNKINAVINVLDDNGEAIKSFVWQMPSGQLISNQAIDESQLITDLLSSHSGYGVQSTIEEKRNAGSFLDAHFLSTGDQIAISGYEPNQISTSVVVLSFPDGSLISTFPVEAGSDVRILPNANKYVTIKGSSGKSEYSTWGLSDGVLISSFTVQDSNPWASSVLFNSPYVYTASATGELFAGAITSDGKITAVKSDGTVQLEAALSGKVLTFSPKDDYMVVSSAGNLSFVNTSTGDTLKSIRLIQPVTGLAVHPTQDLMAVSHPASIEVYQATTQTPVTSLSLDRESNNQFTSLSFSSDGKYLMAQQKEDISGNITHAVWNVSDWSVTSTLLRESGARYIPAPEIFQPLSVLVTSYYGQLSFFNLTGSSPNAETGMFEPVYSVDGTNDVVDIAISPDQKYLAYYGSYQDTPQFVLFDLSKVTNLSDLESAMSSPVLSYPVEWVGEGSSGTISFSPTGDFLAVYDIDFSIFVIDMKTLEIKWKINDSYSHNRFVFSSDSGLLFGDGPVYDMNSEESFSDSDNKEFMGFPLNELPIRGDFIGITHDGISLISASPDGVITYWGVP